MSYGDVGVFLDNLVLSLGSFVVSWEYHSEQVFGDTVAYLICNTIEYSN